MTVPTKTRLAAVAAVLCCAAAAVAFEPEPRLGDAVYVFEAESREASPKASIDTVDSWNRSEVANLYNDVYLPALSVPMQWTGSVAGCVAGTTSQAYIDATFDMANFFRTMVGLPDVTNDATLNAACQEAALIMSANGALSHNPPSSWLCWTSAGAAAAGASNIALGAAGAGAIDLYVEDPGSGNYFVGHRRWVLCPTKAKFGTGSVGETTTKANDLYVFGNSTTRPATPDFVAWPPEGYVPYQTIFPRWSFSVNSGSIGYGSAQVTMTENGSPISLSVVSRSDNGYCDNTIVWEPSGISFTPGGPDRTFTITVSNMTGSADVTYEVVIIDPDVNVEEIFADGFEDGDTDAWDDVQP